MQYQYGDNAIAKPGFVAQQLNTNELAGDFSLMCGMELKLFASGVSEEVKAIWGTLAVLWYLLRAETGSTARNILENTGMLPDMSADMARVRLTSSRLGVMWDSVLKMFDGGLVPLHSEVLAVMCGGMLHKCSMCDETVTICCC